MLALEPFGGLPHPPDLTVSGQARRQGSRQGGRQAGRLELVWRLAGDLEALVLPDPSPSRRRCDGLWQTTCLEAFWGFAGQDAYWELNLAPSGDWNLYRLSHYRGPLIPVALAAAPPWQVRRTAGEWEVAVDIDLGEVAGGDELEVVGLPLEISLTAVIDQGGQGVRETLGNTPPKAQKSLNCPNRTLFCVQMVCPGEFSKFRSFLLAY
jgi:hypothetical protein